MAIKKFRQSRKHSVFITNKNVLTFSLVDYRNNYFTSDDTNKIIEFYNGFDNRDQLIKWMKERPKGVANIYEVDGDKDIIVVIPTADFNGKYAKECRENIFRGLHIIFVESGEIPDPYFNYSHNCNVGIRKAMEYNPKWIVVSNDDVVVEEISNLILLLRTLKGNYYVPKNTYSNLYGQVFNVSASIFFLYSIYKLFKNGFGQFKFNIRILTNKIFSKDLTLISSCEGIIYRILSYCAKPISLPYRNFADFGIFNSDIFKANKFDERFINGYEDGEFCNRLAKNNITGEVIDFEAHSRDGGGNSFGKGDSINRIARDFGNLLMLSYIFKEIN